jgi:hypothetical protein
VDNDDDDEEPSDATNVGDEDAVVFGLIGDEYCGGDDSGCCCDCRDGGGMAFDSEIPSTSPVINVFLILDGRGLFKFKAELEKR